MHFTNTPLQSSLQMLISRLHLAVDMQASKVFAFKTTVMSNMSIPSMKTTWLSIFGPENIIVLLRFTKKMTWTCGLIVKPSSTWMSSILKVIPICIRKKKHPKVSTFFCDDYFLVIQTRWYSNLICGVIRGCLEQLQLRVECRFEKDALNGSLAECGVRHLNKINFK